MKVVNINGPINSGKSTVSKLLVKKLDNALFIEVDDLLSDEEQELLGLHMEEGWKERTDRLYKLVNEYKKTKQYGVIVFAYPISENLYDEWKTFEDETTLFVNITLAPSLEVCLTNRGQRELAGWEISRIKQMYDEGYHNREFADLIIDNSNQTSQETVDEILDFLSDIKKAHSF